MPNRQVINSYKNVKRKLHNTITSIWFNNHHDTKVKPEAASVVIELLMMGGKMPVEL